MKYLLNILILIALVAVIFLKLKENKEIVQERVFHYDKEQAINVYTEKVGMQSSAEENSFTGNFLPNKETKINSESQGKIVFLQVNEGSYVKKGQKLIKLDDSILKLKVKALDVKMDGLQVDINRFRILAEADAIQGVQLEKVELGIKTAQAQKETLLEQIKKTSVYAPFTGVITMKMVELGSFAAPGMPLLILTDINKMKFTVNVPEHDVNRFKRKEIHNIRVDAFPDFELKGKTVMIASKGNRANSYPVQFEVQNPKGQKIKSGMFGKLILGESQEGENIVIPASSIVGSHIKPQVYLAKDGKAILHDIVISSRIQNKVVIERGLNLGDEIITGGFINLFDGANVKTN